jgi:hypothetical protein
MPGRPTAEQVWRGLLRGAFTTKAASAANQWAGRSTIANGQETVTVSTTIVDSDSIILAFPQAVDTVGSTGNAFCVRSINPGNHFILGTADSQPVTRDVDVMWMVFRTQ